MRILGISAYYHDSAACLIEDGKIIAAVQEERFTRIKHDEAFPTKAIEFCLDKAGVGIEAIDYVAFYDKPFIKFERILESYMSYAPRGITSFIKAIPVWIQKKLWIKELIKDELNYTGKIVFPEHHESHAASSFFASPYQEAAFVTADGVGEWATMSFGVGEGNKIKILKEIHFPHSLGLLYSAFTYYTGFKVNSGEYKLMGLAPYGEPKYVDLIYKHLIDVKEDGSFRLNMEYFDYVVGLRMTNKKFDKLFGRPARQKETKITQDDMDIARSIQVVTEEVMLKICNHIHKVTGKKYLCMAGGVALNCVANGRILREGPFENIWIQPAAGDAGGALGAALMTWYHVAGNERHVDNENDLMAGTYLGPGYTDSEIEGFLKENDIPFEKASDEDLPRRVADIIAGENVVGWFNGKMEFGPRALGGRSIIGDARSPKMQETMNLKIKFRESFRPFAPSVLREKVSDYFELDKASPYMLLVADVKKERCLELTEEQKKLFGIEKLNVARSDIPAVTHVDYSARIQTVTEKQSPFYYKVIKELDKNHGSAVIINTSFNVRGEPIVCTPQDAFRCFMRTNMDYLVLDNYILDKKAQKPLEKDTDWQTEFELD